MTPKQIKANIGKVVEWNGQRWFLLDSIQSKGNFNVCKKRTFAVIGARGERYEVLPKSLKLAE